MDSKTRYILTVYGKTGAGKSSLLRALLASGTLSAPVFVLDTMDDFHGGLQFESMEHLLWFLAEMRENRSNVYILKASSDRDVERFWRFVANLKQPMTLVIDECSKYCSPSQIIPELHALIHYGRHWGANLILVARRPVELHNDVRAMADASVSFRLDHPADFKRLEELHPSAIAVKDLKMARPDLGIYIGEYIIIGDTGKMPFGKMIDGHASRVHPVEPAG